MKRFALAATAAFGAAAIVPQAASAQLYMVAPDFSTPPADMLTPALGLPLPEANILEQRAAILWNLRAGLNVAALQCHHYKILDSVDNYNNFIATHAGELGPAHDTLQGYFVRNAETEREGKRAFDRFNTRTYNSFSTLYGKRSFCQTAGDIARDALFVPRGQIMMFAQRRLGELRRSLRPTSDNFWTRRTKWPVSYGPIYNHPPSCFKKDGTVKKKCLRSDDD
ncbi:hypothetical protein [Sphingomicrobium sediminis]|uniref:Uncharacterized protein n=1 Tax=Sphingomicrobium sediminis TaxID=2950949 RepID=A0A9X2EI31_9SPHN|nr:hypothetical protein [Sphingomicrobium sediminis]MCM8557146.1 hypothetical protein [Sphingomicrobium sediminis]